MANRQTIDRLLDALEARLPRPADLEAQRSLDLCRFEQELEEVVQLAERIDAAHFRDRIDVILAGRRH